MDRAGAERTAAEVTALGRRASVVPTDVTSRDDLRAMAARARAELGRIDVLVNNAGIYRAAAPLDVTEEHWDAVMRVNARAVFFASQAVLPAMIAQKRGSIVSVASMAGKIGNRNNLPYNVSKAAASPSPTPPTGSGRTASARASWRPTCGRPSPATRAP
ncbi:MAG: SDR family NAD(P)-dependent oxidoreductase [Candidatus Rokubacteria bacterium]|nr:SDR family NAD(P)-dependent oxidoreductase [Candidatus Rokubacteria bacterium]